MTLTLHLPPDLEKRLTEEATRHGVPVDAYTVRVLEQCVPPKDRTTEVVNLLQSWLDETDSQDQQDTGKYLIQALDDHRLSNRRLFTPELQGVTW